jgi:ABC-2 type transport system permease protein
VLRNILAVALKETKTYFSTPPAYITAMVFLALTGYYFVQSISVALPEASLRTWATSITLVFVLWAPVLTMRLLAEEQKLGTLELLMTAPIRDVEIVIGKYLAALVVLVSTLALTLLYVALLAWYGDPDVGPIFAGYLGLLLYGAATLAIGLLASSFSPNQIVSAVVGFGVLLLLTLIGQAAPLTEGITKQVLEQISLTNHMQDFARGIIDTHGVVYFVLLTVFMLFLTARNLESRRWR